MRAWALLATLVACASAGTPVTPRATPAVTPDAVERLVVTDQVTFVFRVSRLANLVYQLDCISGSTRSCSRAVFDELWAKRLGRQAGDAEALAS